MRRRIDVLGHGESPFARHLEQILDGANVHLFIAASSELDPIALGCGDITSWWPEPLRFAGNFGRHFLQTELPRAGALSRDIDDYVRHHLSGCGRGSSTSDRILRAMADRLLPLLDKVFDAVAIVPIAGLSRRLT
jgi:hypothetical protein